MKPPPSACPFCAFHEERVVHSHDLAFVIRDGFPISPGHSLIIPRRHVASLAELDVDEVCAIWSLMTEARRALELVLRPDGWNVGVNDGVAAGQTVMHLHVHLVPRYRGDRADPRGGVRWIIPERAAYWGHAVGR